MLGNEPMESSPAKDGRSEEEVFMASSMRTVREGLKPIMWLWAIGLAAVFIGRSANSPSAIPPLLEMVFFSGGVLLLFAAVVATAYGIWLGAPVLMARISETYRPFAKLGFVLLWASVPLWFYYSLHARPLDLVALLNYVEFRGFFVVKMFLVGIVAFAVRRNHDSEPYRNIQPYVLIPVACLFLGGWLAPDEDEAAWRSGLTLPLVYYVGVTFAACVGFFLGQSARQAP
jgi:hypothetical protein